MKILTTMSRSACVPVNTGMSMGTWTEYGLFRRTPKFLSPLSSSRMNTPMCMRPTRATPTTTHTHQETRIRQNLYLICVYPTYQILLLSCCCNVWACVKGAVCKNHESWIPVQGLFVGFYSANHFKLAVYEQVVVEVKQWELPRLSLLHRTAFGLISLIFESNH